MNLNDKLVNKNQAVESLKLVQEIIDQTGTRLAGTSECKKAVEIIHNKLKPYCDLVKIEEFKFAREAFLFFMKILAITYPISLIFLSIGRNWFYLSAILLTCGAVIAFFEFVLYKELIDIFFKKFTGYNAVGIIEPKKEVKQNIIISSHHDCAYVFNFFKRWQKVYAPRIAIGIIIYYFAFFFTLYWLIYKFLIGHNPGFINQIQYIFLFGLPFVTQFYFFKSNEVTSGAGDDLIGCAIGIKLGEIFGKAKKDGNPLLEHTRLIILSADAEESGLRGARAYVKIHREELKSIPTFNLNIDNIYNVNELSFLTSDINGTVKLSKNMVNQCVNIAKDLGYKIPSGPITFGGGATDAAEFSKIGIEAVSLIGMENKLIRDNLVYHTMNDTVDKIEPEAVLACLRIATQYISIKDREVKEIKIK